jgi:hypothetical protein
MNLATVEAGTHRVRVYEITGELRRCLSDNEFDRAPDRDEVEALRRDPAAFLGACESLPKREIPPFNPSPTCDVA